MKRRWSYIAGLFLLMLGIFTGCEGLSELPDMPDQGIVQGEYAKGDSPDKEDSLNKKGSPNKEDNFGEKDSSDNKDSFDGKDNPDKKNNPNEKVDPEGEPDAVPEAPEATVQEDGEYTSKEEVAAYLYAYGHLPDNFITKKDAKELGWVSSEGNLHEVAPGKSIGGDYFGNYEEILPKQSGRKYYECDIDTDGSYRGAKRIVYSNDGLIYYTEDHYATFELLYTEDGPAEE